MELSPIEIFIKENISIVQYFNDHLVDESKRIYPLAESASSSTICPFHDDPRPSFRYWKVKKFFKCFGCDAAGDVIQLHVRTRALKGTKINRMTAVKELLEMYNLKTSIPIEVLEQEKRSAFDIARDRLSGKEQIAKSKRGFTITSFIKANNVIKNSRMPVEAKVKNYAELDLQASAIISEVNDS